MRRMAEALALWLAGAGVAVLGLAILALMADIAMRKSIGVSITGTVDLTQLAQMACVSLALPMVFLREGNVSVDLLADRLPARARTALMVLVHLCCAGLLAAMAWYSLRQALLQVGQGDRSQTLGIPMLAYWVPLLAGLTLSTGAALLLAARDLGKLRHLAAP